MQNNSYSKKNSMYYALINKNNENLFYHLFK